MDNSNRLPRNFHNSFKPERHYINAMLRFAASGKSGDYQMIAADTGIPMGSSSGKVPAILDYCRGMGLIHLSGSDRSAIKIPELTSFGRIVLLEDPFLKTDVTQWIAHLNLCGAVFGAEVWYQTFFAGTQSLGMRYERSKLESYLGMVIKANKSGLIGPMIGTYEDEAALSRCGALSEVSGTITRKIAPIRDEFSYAYGAWLIQLMVDHFPKHGQVSTTELDTKAGWKTIPGWDSGNHPLALQQIETKGLIEVDRHMEPWLIRPKIGPELAWREIYNDLI